MLSDEKISFLVDPMLYYETYGDHYLRQRIGDGIGQRVTHFHYGYDVYDRPPQCMTFELPRASGKSFSIALYAIWYATFHNDSTVGVCASSKIALNETFNAMRYVHRSVKWNDFMLAQPLDRYSDLYFDNGAHIVGLPHNTHSPIANTHGYRLDLLIADDVELPCDLPILKPHARVISVLTPRI